MGFSEPPHEIKIRFPAALYQRLRKMAWDRELTVNRTVVELVQAAADAEEKGS